MLPGLHLGGGDLYRIDNVNSLEQAKELAK